MFSRSLSLEKWTGDGKEIIFRAPNGSPMAVPVSANGAAFQPGFLSSCSRRPLNNRWDVTSDGERFLVDVQPGDQNGQAPITVVLNWAADLKH